MHSQTVDQGNRNLRRRLTALQAGMRAALRALRANNRKR